MRVIKIGGTSVGEYHAIEEICYILRDKNNNYKEDRYAIIVSAIVSITDKLVKCALYAEQTNEKFHIVLDEIEIQHFNLILNALTKRRCFILVIKFITDLYLFYETIYKYTVITKKSLEKMINFGELISSYFINEKNQEFGCNSICKDSRYLIVIDYPYESGQFNFIKSLLKIKKFLIKENTPYIILPGFIASSTSKETSILKRGGSDYSASIFSAALQAEFLEIWTDVSGIMTANPNKFRKYFTFENLSYLSLLELSNFWTKVIYSPTLLSNIKSIPVMIKNTLSPLEIGTLIFGTFKRVITVFTHIPDKQNITLLTLDKKLDMPGCPNLFIKQNSYSVPEFYIEILNSFNNEIYTTFSIDKSLSIIIVIVNYMKNIPVTSVSMFSAFGKENIKMRVIISTEEYIYAVIEKDFLKKSMITLHEIFFESPYKKIHIFIARLGQVVNKLIGQFHKQKDYLVDELHIHIRVIGICNRNRIILNNQGFNIKPINKLKNNIKLVTSTDIEEYIVKLYNLNLCNSIFIDNTDRKEIGNLYIEILRKGIAIITFNKVACASFCHDDKNIKSIARYFKAPFFFEPSVSIGLINTLIFGVKSADKIIPRYAGLSISLNLIFKKGYFIDIVSESQRRGFTEFDIRLDLSGIDVIRKNLIIVRETSEDIELEDIKQISLLPKSCIKAITIDRFYNELTANEEFLTQLHIGAKEQRKRINFMAKYKYGKTSVGIEYLSFYHTFFQLEDKNSKIRYTTDEPSIIVKEAVITSYGVFSNIIKTTKLKLYERSSSIFSSYYC